VKEGNGYFQPNAALHLVASVPRLSVMMARATDWIRMRSSLSNLVHSVSQNAARLFGQGGFSVCCN
jgi:hypothetical protein